MAVDEYGDFSRRIGTRLLYIDGIWWRQVRPFFFRPLYPYFRTDPGSVRSPRISTFGGFQHLVMNSDLSNSFMNFLVLDNLQEYSINALSHDCRKNIRRASRKLTIRRICDEEEFIRSGYRIYMSSYCRTKYAWNKKLLKQEGFARWAKVLFDFTKILILGAYRNDELEAIGLSYLIEDTLIYGTFFCSTQGLRLRTSELMLHTIREIASKCASVKRIYMGMPGRKTSLDMFKINRGCSLVSEPAYLRINPVARFLMKRFRKGDYIRLVGFDQKKVITYPE